MAKVELIRLDVNDQHHQIIQRPNADHSLFAIIFSTILEQHQGTGEHLFSIGEIQAVLDQVRLSLGSVQYESFHAMLSH